MFWYKYGKKKVEKAISMINFQVSSYQEKLLPVKASVLPIDPGRKLSFFVTPSGEKYKAVDPCSFYLL